MTGLEDLAGAIDRIGGLVDVCTADDLRDLVRQEGARTMLSGPARSRYEMLSSGMMIETVKKALIDLERIGTG